MSRLEICCYLLLAVAGSLSSACGDSGAPSGNSPVAIATIEVTPDSATVAALGATVQFTAVARDAEGEAVSGARITWSSTDTNFVRLDSAGLATAVRNGTVRITATTGGRTGTAWVTVAQVPAHISVSPPTASLTAIGANAWFGATARDANNNIVARVPFTWSSSDTAIATVDSTGQVVATGPGSTTITAAAGDISGSATLQVTPTATELGFTVQPTTTWAGVPMAPAAAVSAQDSRGNTVTSFADTVTVALAPNPTHGRLAGTITAKAVNGSAAFPDLRIDRPGTGYTLVATSGTLAGATSAAFDIRVTFASMSPGSGYTCGLTTAGVIFCWGYNAHGELGDSTATGPERCPQYDPCSQTPVPVLGGLTFVATSAGLYHNCAVTTAGAAYCWGSNNAGQLGDGSTVDRTSPVAVVGGLTFAEVDPGVGGHSCGVTAEGAAYCWGSNAYGELGDGTTVERTSPVAVVGGLTFAGVSAGMFHSCGVTTGGAAYCWGYDGNGELGDGTGTESTSPVAVTGAHTFASVSAGVAYSCGVTTEGAAYCWGANGDGRLGDSSTVDHWASPVPVAGGHRFATVSARFDHACGLSTAGAVYCWGYNGDGELGDGTTTTRASPVAVAGGLTFATVGAGANHSCGVTTGGVAYCWGLNTEGELGDGTTGSSPVPARVVQ
jgi:alpha-tubulin suppressor-like RCC1 family protein